MKLTLLLTLVVIWCFSFVTPFVLATSNYEYGSDEYVTVVNGMSPCGKYAVTAHGEGDYGYKNFYIYLTRVENGMPICKLNHIVDVLDTGADAYFAKWSNDSNKFYVVYRISRHEPLKVVMYKFINEKLLFVNGPTDASKEQAALWRSADSEKMSGKVFGKPRILNE
jgi:hypothetical protein